MEIREELMIAIAEANESLNQNHNGDLVVNVRKKLMWLLGEEIVKDKSKRIEYWKWYINEAIPNVYLSIKDDNLS